MIHSRFFKTNAYTIIGIVGIFLSVYLALLKIVDVPCATGGGCHNVLNSKYSTIAGIPVSLFSIILWSIFLGSTLLFRKISAAALIAGSVYFTYLQVFRIDGFCIFCFVHAIVSLLTFPLFFRQEKASPNTSIIALVLPNCFVLATLLILYQKHTIYQYEVTIGNTPMVVEDDEFFPLQQGFHIVESPVDSPKKLLLSFDCNHCLDTLFQLLDFTIIRIEQNQPVFETPVLYFDTSPASVELTQTVLSIFKANNNSLHVMKDCVGMLRESVINGQNLESSLERIQQKYDVAVSREIVDQLAVQADLFKKHQIRFVPQFFLQNHPISRFTVEDLVETINRPLLSISEPLETFGIIPEEGSVTRASTVENMGSTGAYLMDGILLNGAGRISFDKHYILPGQKTRFSITLTNTEPFSGRIKTDFTYHLPKYASMGINIEASFPKHGYVIQNDIHRLEDDGFFVNILSLKNEPVRTVSILNPNLSIGFVSRNGSEYRYVVKNIKDGFLESYQGIINFEIEITDTITSIHTVYFEHRRDEKPVADHRIETTNPSPVVVGEDVVNHPQSLKNSPIRFYPERPLNKNILVVSPRCPACIERLAAFDQYLQEHNDASVPEFIWDEHGDEELLGLVLSYVLVQNEDLSPLLLWLREINQQDVIGEALVQSFSENFPDIMISGENGSIIEFYRVWLRTHPVSAVPSLITKSGLVTTRFSSEDITNDEFHQAKLVPRVSDIDLGVGTPGETIQFSFKIENQGTEEAELSDVGIPSLPNGKINWNKQKITAGESADATVTWVIPADYSGEAFARVHYDAKNLNFTLPVHLLVPQNGWVWPNVSSILSDLPVLTFQNRNVDFCTGRGFQINPKRLR